MVDADSSPVSEITVERAEIFRAAAQVIVGDGASPEDFAAAITNAAIELDTRVGLPPRDSIEAVALAGIRIGYAMANRKQPRKRGSRTIEVRPSPPQIPVAKKIPMKASPRKEGDRK